MVPVSQGNKKELNFELNLMPVIDILTVCVCFMLMTVVWIQVGALQASQSVGGQAQVAKANPPSAWLEVSNDGNIKLTLRDVSRRESFPREVKLSGQNHNVNLNQLENVLTHMEHQAPSIQTALIIPAEHVAYDDIIQMMSLIKKVGIRDVGLSPL